MFKDCLQLLAIYFVGCLLSVGVALGVLRLLDLQPIPVPQAITTTAERSEFRLRGALFCIVTRVGNLAPGQTQGTLLVERLADDEAFAQAAEKAVKKLAADQGVDLDKMNIHDMLAWLWANREAIIKMLMELLPLFIH